MDKRRVSISTAKGQLSHVVNRVAFGGERVLIESHGRPKAVLIGVEDLRSLKASGVSAAITLARRNGLVQIEKLCGRMRKARPRPTLGDSVDDIHKLRRSRDERLRGR